MALFPLSEYILKLKLVKPAAIVFWFKYLVTIVSVVRVLSHTVHRYTSEEQKMRDIQTVALVSSLWMPKRRLNREKNSQKDEKEKK